MKGMAWLVWRYVCFNWGKTVVLVLCLLLAALLPIAVSILLRQFSQQIVARSEATEAVVGHAGSGLDLALHAIYFRRGVDQTIPFSEAGQIRDSGLATPIPLFCRFTARGFPLVGTTVDYFPYRNLQIGQGRMLVRLGECVIGSRVAQRLGVAPGDFVLSDRENIIDIGGLYPLKLKVAGVLATADSADDSAVFVDLKTAWVIQGLGHGHQDLQAETDPLLVMSRDDQQIVASPAVLPYTAITDANIASFHFHGEEKDFPLTAVIIDSPDEKSATLLLGRYPSHDGMIQMVVPKKSIDELLGMIFQTEKLFLANSVLIAVSTALLMGLVVMLSIRLRTPEMTTMFKIGCSRHVAWSLQAGELLVVIVFSAGLLAVSVWTIQHFASDLVQRLVVGS